MMGKQFMPRTARLWVYSVTIAIIPLGVFLGWWEEPVAALIPPIILALLNLTPDDVQVKSIGEHKS